jgi:hypothetical protein
MNMEKCMKEMMDSCMGNNMEEMMTSMKNNQSDGFNCSSMMQSMNCCGTKDEDAKNKEKATTETNEKSSNENSKTK